jgi:hypothetical protein
MRIRYLSLLCLAGGMLFGGAACDVQQTEPGRAPDLDVNIGGDPGRWPEYDVQWADVDVGTRERTITVPVVRVVEETREVSVPYIDINPPGARDREERTVSMDVDVPHPGYQFQIAEIRAAADNLWVIGRLTETGAPEGTAAASTTRVSDQVVINAPDDLDVRRVVVGARPSGVLNQQFRFVDDMQALNQLVPGTARVLYQR